MPLGSVESASKPLALSRNCRRALCFCIVEPPVHCLFFRLSCCLHNPLLFLIHSHLSATIGSTFAARRAGIQQATSATTTNKTVTVVNVGRSVGLTLKSNALIRRVNP